MNPGTQPSAPVTRVERGPGYRAAEIVATIIFGLGFGGALAVLFLPLGVIILVLVAIRIATVVAHPEGLDTLIAFCPICGNQISVRAFAIKEKGFDCKFCKHHLVRVGIAGAERFVAF